MSELADAIKLAAGHQVVMLQGRNKPAPAILSGLPAQALHAKHQSKLAATSTDAVSTDAVERRPPAKLVQFFEGDLQHMAALASLLWQRPVARSASRGVQLALTWRQLDGNAASLAPGLPADSLITFIIRLRLVAYWARPSHAKVSPPHFP